MLARWEELREIVLEMDEQFLPIRIPDVSLRDTSESHLVGTYLLIMFGTNPHDKYLLKTKNGTATTSQIFQTS